MKKDPTIYIYNDTFTSLLTLMLYLLDNKIIPKNIFNTTYNPNLFDNTLNLNLPEKENIIGIYLQKFGKNIFNTLYFCFISNHENKEILMYYFLVHSLQYKDKIFYLRNLKSVATILKITKYVKNENHKMKGFLRFQELDNHILYAKMAPENDIIFLLSKHFATRLRNEYWIIEDVKRGIYSIYDKKDYYLISKEDFIPLKLEFSKEEKEMQELWQKFYHTIGIKERKNDRCRMNFMPKKYWKYIIEMEGIYEKNN